MIRGSVFLDTINSTWRGDSPGDPCYEVGENNLTKLKKCIHVDYIFVVCHITSSKFIVLGSLPTALPILTGGDADFTRRNGM